VLFIPKDAFAGIPANAVVDFKLKEAYNLLDMVSENLNTQSNGKVLQTGGMFNAEARFNSKPLTLKKDLKVTFPTPESQLDGMQLFTGARNEQQNGRMNWTPINATNDRTASFTDEKELIIYSQNGKFDPFLLMNGEGVLTFKEIIDTTRCLPLLTKQQLDQAQTTGKEVKIDRLSNTGFALSLNYNVIKDNKITFFNIPQNKNAILFAMKVENGQPYLAFHDIKTDKPHYDLDFKPVSAEEIKVKFQSLK
jgi:hypothetical protein